MKLSPLLVTDSEEDLAKSLRYQLSSIFIHKLLFDFSQGFKAQVIYFKSSLVLNMVLSINITIII